MLAADREPAEMAERWCHRSTCWGAGGPIVWAALLPLSRSRGSLGETWLGLSQLSAE